jgi:predicted CoA-binding protein
MTHTTPLIHEFLKTKRFAMVGVSRNPNDFSRTLFKEFVTRGHDIVPVNPHIPLMEGRRCFQNLREVSPPVTAAILMTPKSAIEQTLLDCAEAGITLVWIYGLSGERNIDPDSLRFCKDHGMKVIAGHCPYMFMQDAGLVHRFHGAVWKMIGRYPA